MDTLGVGPSRLYVMAADQIRSDFNRVTPGRCRWALPALSLQLRP